MIAYDDGFRFDEVYCYPAEEKNTYFFLPLAPRPETDASGDPTLTSIPMGDGGFLQLGTRLEAGEETLDALRAELVQRLELEEPALIRLRMAPLSVEGAVLLIGQEPKSLEEVTRSSTSGFAPYTALFHVQLDAAQQNAVAAALNGREGFVRVRYDVSLAQPVTVQARVFGAEPDLLAELAGLVSQADTDRAVQQLLEEAFAKQALHLEIEASEVAPADLSERAAQRVRQETINLLRRMYREKAPVPDEVTLLAEVELSEEVSQSLELTTDIASWFAPDGGIPEPLILPGAGSPSPSS